MTAALALQNLLNNPERFLKKTAIIVGEPSDHPPVSGVVKPTFMGQPPKYNFMPQKLPVNKGMEAFSSYTPTHYIHHQQASSVRKWYPLDNSGPAVAITTKLTGCSVAVQTTPGGIMMCHIQPTGTVPGDQLRNELAGDGYEVFGRGDYNLEQHSATVVALRSGSQWSVFAQKRDKTSDKVLDVVRLV